jgi:hypothetical protein
MGISRLSYLFVLTLLWSSYGQAEIYQWLDSNGRLQFSDTPPASFSNSPSNSPAATHVPSTDISEIENSSVSSAKRTENLQRIAKKLKKDRLKREKVRAKELRSRAKKDKKRKKKLAAAKKRKAACKKARTAEDLAFRQRTKRHGLNKMRKALANYEKKRQARQNKCS